MKKCLVLISLLVLITGCNGTTEKASTQTKTIHYYEKEFKFFDGVEEIKMKLEEDIEVEVKFDIDLEEGEIEFTIEDEDGKEYATVNSTETVKINIEGNKFYLIINADEANGYFEVDWRH